MNHQINSITRLISQVGLSQSMMQFNTQISHSDTYINKSLGLVNIHTRFFFNQISQHIFGAKSVSKYSKHTYTFKPKKREVAFEHLEGRLF